MSDFDGQDLSGSTFDWTDLSGSTFTSASLSNTVIRGTDLHHVKMRGVELIDVDISGELRDVVVNGVDIGPLVEAELDRRDPRRAKMRPTDPDGFREAWDIVEEMWQPTVERARRLDPEQLHVSVEGEWSFVETLRHLVFATESWVGRALLGDPSPWHPLSLPWSEMPDTEGIPRDRGVRPSLEEVLELRRDRMGMVRRVVDGLTHEALASETDPLVGSGWPAEGSRFPVQECLRIVLNEEWEHRRYADRDLAVLEAESTPS